MKIPITKIVFDEEEKKAIIKPLETGWIVQGPYVADFERYFAEFTKAKYAIATASCTAALHSALEAIGISKADKVIVPSFTYVASANSVEYTGAEVEFCDIDLKTFNINIDHLNKILINDKDKKIKAIVPVNLFGLCANLPAIINLSSMHELKVIEDSACGFDSWICDKHSGTFGNAGCFSFHPRKCISTGEGGMIITNDVDIANNSRSLRDHGASKSDMQRHEERGGSLLPEFNVRGYNYRMTDFQGALGISQMKKSKKIMEGRRRIAYKYNEALADIKELITPYVPDNYIHSYQSYVCLFNNGEDIENLTIDRIDKINIARNKFMYKLEDNNIATRQGTHAVHTLGYYRKKYSLKNADYINSYAADRLSVTLPLYADMTDEEFDYVIVKIKEALR